MNYKLILELTTSSHISNSIDIGFVAPFGSLSKLNVDYFRPHKSYTIKQKLKVPEGYKFPDFPTEVNYDPESPVNPVRIYKDKSGVRLTPPLKLDLKKFQKGKLTKKKQ